MKKSVIFVICACFLATASGAPFDPAGWKYCAKVTVDSGADEYCGLFLAPEIYNVARPDLGDIRLMDDQSKQVPYVIARPKDTVERQQHHPSLINRSTNAENAALVTLDFGQRVTKNSIEVVTQGANFRRAVRVEGSNDNVEFFTLVKLAYVFAVDPDRHFGQIDLPTNDYQYLRITIWPMPEEKTSPLIQEVKSFKIIRELAKRQTVGMAAVEQSEDEKSRSSIYTYDLAFRHLPITEIELDVPTESFYRYITLEGRDEAKRKVELASEDGRQRVTEVEVPWQRLVGDTIYRYTDPSGQKHEKLVIQLPSGTKIPKYVRITISNYDDEPILVRSSSAKLIADEIIFPSDYGAELTLYVGSASLSAPRYDLKYQLNNPLEIKTRTAKTGGIVDNPLFREAAEKSLPWTERHRFLLLVTLIIVALVLGVFILKSFRSIRGQQTQD
jgi:hypothetical protein